MQIPTDSDISTVAKTEPTAYEIITDTIILKQISTPINAFETDEISQALIETWKKVADKASGLAAPQIGILKRAFIARLHPNEDTEKVFLFINPQITVKGEIKPSIEGCLSIPNVTRTIGRYSSTTIHAELIIDLDGNAYGPMTVEGRDAAVLQHESDHLNGVLIDSYPDIDERINKVWERQNKRIKRIQNNRQLKKKNTNKTQKMTEKRRNQIDKNMKQFLKFEKKRVQIQEHFKADQEGW